MKMKKIVTPINTSCFEYGSQPATNKTMAEFASQFTKECKRRNCFGIACVTAPAEEEYHMGGCADFVTFLGMMKCLFQDIARRAGVPHPSALAQDMAVYLAAVEYGVINERNSKRPAPREQMAVVAEAVATAILKSYSVEAKENSNG